MFDKIKKFFVQGEGATTDIFIGGDSNFDTMIENVTDSKILNNFQKSLYLFMGLDKIATALSSIEIKLFKVLDEMGNSEQVYGHEILDMLNDPNENQNLREFIRIFAINIKTTGESFIRKIRDENGNHIGLVNVRPDIVDVKIKEVTAGEGKEVVYIIHIGHGKTIELTRTDMIHVKLPDPLNQLRGASLLRPLLGRLTAEQRATHLQNVSFTNNGRPDGILSVKGITTQDEADRIKRKMANTFSGSNEGSRTAILSSDMKYQQVSLSAKDMDFMESLGFIRNDILAGLGVPLELIDMKDSSKMSSGGDRGLGIFNELTIEPLAKLFIEAMNEGIIKDEYSEPFILIHTSFIREDRKALIDEVDKMVRAGVYTPNDGRKMLGKEEIDGADELKMQNIAGVFNGKSWLHKRVMKRLKVQRKVEELVKKEFLTAPTPEYKKAYYKAINTVTDKNIKKLESETKKYFREQKARVKKNIKELDDAPLTVSDIFDLQVEGENTKRLAMQTFPTIALNSGNAGLTPIKSFYAKVDDFVMDTELIAMIEERAIMFAEHVAGLTYAQIKDIIASGLADGVGRDVVTRNIYDMFDNMERVRAKRIAQTEGTNMSNLGLQQAFNKEDLVTGKEWITSKDGRVRDEHVMNDGVVVDKDVAFPNGERFPADKSINCRCVIAPVIK